MVSHLPQVLLHHHCHSCQTLRLVMVQVADPGRDTVRLESRSRGRNSQRGQAVVVGGWPEDRGRAASTPKGPSAGSRGEQVEGKGSEDPLLVLSDPTLSCHHRCWRGEKGRLASWEPCHPKPLLYRGCQIGQKGALGFRLLCLCCGSSWMRAGSSRHWLSR